MAKAKAQIELIVGLGNPGSEYAETRHNAGFWFIDRYVADLGSTFSTESRFFGDVAKVATQGRTLRLLKPMQYMNRSGQAVAALSRYFKIPADGILVIHDELDLPPGDARIKFSGGHGGHNGLRDLISHLGSRDFWRVRLGIGHPGHQSEVVNYVLKTPSRDDTNAIDDAVSRVLAAMPLIAQGEMQLATNDVHSQRPKPSPPTEK
ncbi:MAG: aminoacyl-tRNA hydrolase [Planctomycetota bacterium]